MILVRKSRKRIRWLKTDFLEIPRKIYLEEDAGKDGFMW
jgi:hypothetical protein